MKKLGIFLLIILWFHSVIYLTSNILPNLKGECEVDYVVGFSLVDVGVSGVALGLACVLLYGIFKLGDLINVSESKVEVFYLFSYVVILVLVLLTCYVQYQYCGSMNIIEFIKLKINM